MYQLEVVGTFIAMFSLGIIVLISGFIWTRLEKKKDSKRTPDHFVKVCQNETCKKLNELMIKLMVTRLKFEDETQEISDVKEHLKIMKTQVHLNESDPLLARQEIFQCLRSTLVQHPNDVRGRRRANIARKILVYEVNEETNLLYEMEVWFNSKREAFYDTFLSCFEKKKVKKCVKLWQIRLHVLFKMVLYAADTFSDLTIIVVIWQSMVQLGSYGHPPPQGITGVLYNNTILPTQEVKSEQSIWTKNEHLSNCFLNDTEVEMMKKFKTDGSFLANILVSYLDQLLLYVLLSLLVQFYVVFQLMQVEMMNRKGTLKNILSIVTSLLFPIKMFWTSYKIQMYLQDPDKEHVECLADVKSGDLEPDEKAKRENLKQMEEFMLYKSRFSGHITEGFIESQAAIRVQIGFYLAFSFVVSQNRWKDADCIAQALLGEEGSIFKFYTYNVIGVPILLFSSISSLLSITMAQFSLYKSKHEFDLNIFGKACYFLCSLGLTFSKLAGQIFYIMALQALVLNSDVPEYIKALAYLITYLIIIILHNLKESFINLWMAAKNDSGSYLSVKFVPTATNTNMFSETWRFNPRKKKKCCKFCSSDNWLRKRNWSWLCCVILPLQSIREAKHPDVYSFQDGAKSRTRYRERFALALGLNFLFTCFDIAFGFTVLHLAWPELDVMNGKGRFHLKVGTILWLLAIPIYCFALLLLYLFYKFGHIWSRENIALGYQYDCQNDQNREIWQRKFKGNWVSHSIKPYYETPKSDIFKISCKTLTIMIPVTISLAGIIGLVVLAVLNYEDLL